jgi:chromosome segregation ATPase
MTEVIFMNDMENTGLVSDLSEEHVTLLVKEFLENIQAEPGKDMEHHAIFISGKLTGENKMLRERLSSVTEENKVLKEKLNSVLEDLRFYKEQLQHLPGLPDEIMEMFRVADFELQEKNNDISDLQCKIDSWKNHASNIEKRLTDEINKTWWKKLL